VPTLLAALTAFLEAAVPVRRARLLAPLVKTAQASLAAGFARQGKLLAGHLASLVKPVREAATDAPPAPSWLDAWTIAAILAAWDALTVETASTLQDAIDTLARASLLAGASESVADLGVGVSFDLANPRAVHYLTKYGAARVTQIDQTTRDQLQTLLANALAQALRDVHSQSVGRWRRDLTEKQVAEVEAEAGPLLRELGY